MEKSRIETQTKAGGDLEMIQQTLCGTGTQGHQRVDTEGNRNVLCGSWDVGRDEAGPRMCCLLSDF